MLNYRDVTSDPDAQAQQWFPEIIDTLLDLGFKRAAIAAVTVEDPVAVSQHYKEPDRTWFAESANRPTTLLHSPDRDAFAELSGWFGDSPSLRFRSVLDDGSVVETVRQWERLPILNRELNEWGDQQSVKSRQTRGHSPSRGRSKRAIIEGDPGKLWEIHKTHLKEIEGRRGAKAIPHGSFDDWLKLSKMVFAHDTATARQASMMTPPLMGAIGIGFVAAMPLMLLFAGAKWTIVVLVLAAWFTGAYLAPWVNWVSLRLTMRFPPDFVPPTDGALLLRRTLYAGSAAVVLGGLIAVGMGAGAVGYMTMMPVSGHEGALEELTDEEAKRAKRLRASVDALATEIGERNVDNFPGALELAAVWVEKELQTQGFEVRRQAFEARGVKTRNLIVEIPGESEEIVVIGAHYDSAPGTPGANDNATGVAVLLELSEVYRDIKPYRTLRFVAFTNEEPPWFKSEKMGSLVYARSCAEAGDDIVAMVSLETMGFYSDDPGTQHYPKPFSALYPDQGNFIGFVSDLTSRELLHDGIAAFRHRVGFPSEGAALPRSIPGTTWSDHWSFWMVDYPAIMVTDTAPNRYAHYHEQTDTTDKVDFERLARVTSGMEAVVSHLQSPDYVNLSGWLGSTKVWLGYLFFAITVLGWAIVGIFRAAAEGSRKVAEVWDEN